MSIVSKHNAYVLSAIMTAILLLSIAFVPISSANSDLPDEEGFLLPPIMPDNPRDFPATYDLRDNGLVTNAKDQGIYGTCWAYSAMSCMETNLINKGYETKDVDLSELQLTYYMFNMETDPLKGLDGDSIVTSLDYRQIGGNDQQTMFCMTAWRGAIYESAAPYEWIEMNDLTLPNETEFQSNMYILTDVKLINPEDMNSIKDFLMGGNSVSLSYYADILYYTLEESENGNRTSSYYCPEEKTANHEVTIVGWDDDYSAENFTYAPEGNGAWLVKNSWGTNNKYVDQNGYFWISYYTHGRDTSSTYNLKPIETYDNNYQYDGGVSMIQDRIYEKTGYMSNIFTAKCDETLRAASIVMMQDLNVDYTICVYTGLTNPNDPTSGELRTTQKGTTNNAGYYTIDLDHPVKLNPGTTFSIVVEVTDTDGSVHLAVDTSVNLIDIVSHKQVAESITKALPGQSFVSGDGITWTDIGADGTSNIRIKAFTTNDDGTDTTTYIVILAVLLIISAIGLAYCFRKYGDKHR